MTTAKPFRVLSLDGGGMRGTYTATYLSSLGCAFSRKRGVLGIDIGAAFDLIVGTSTGGIIACALAAGRPLEKVVDLYRTRGSEIFSRRLPTRLRGVLPDLLFRRKTLAAGDAVLREALAAEFGEETLGGVYRRRGIALALTSVELSQHRSWVFKTPHIPGTNFRDSNYRLVDVCMATTAAPLFRSMAAVAYPDQEKAGHNVFVDGGLWANNPVLVGLIDALETTTPDQAIEVFCLGTCPRPSGERVPPSEVHRGLMEWKFGGVAASLSIDAQEFAYDNMARMFARHLDRPCTVVRFPRDQIPAELMPYLDLDDTRPAAISALIDQARSDANMTNSRCNDSNSREGKLICALFNQAPFMTEPPSPKGAAAVRSETTSE